MPEYSTTALAECAERAALWRDAWDIDPQTTYLNHGSFAPTPRCVQTALAHWTKELASNPMDFYLRRSEVELDNALRRLAGFLGANRECLVFSDNATTAMNIVADSIELAPGDEVLMNDHEYGAVFRIWRRTAQARQARVVTATMPDPIDDPEAVVEQLLQGVTSKTRLIVVSHVTSPTAIVMPVEQICQRASKLGIPVCIDGPHAIAMRAVHLGQLQPDFYTASCHKWLCGPLGSGFLYVAPKWQKQLQPSVVSWGGSVGGRQPSWKDEFNWIGTRNPANFLAVSAAIDFWQQSPSPSDSDTLAVFRAHSRELIRYAAAKVTENTGLPPFIRDLDRWCGSMVSLPLPNPGTPPKPGHRDPLQDRLWERHRIEIPIVHWNGRRFIRVSAHLYNGPRDIDVLCEALRAS